MAVPSFARATASSTLKASPNGGKSNDVTTTQGSGTFSGTSGTDRKLKRPSTLTRRARESIAYNADLYHIKPSNPSKPCPLAALPSELRTLIYSHTFGDLQSPVLMNYGRKRHSPSKLLQTCRAIRIEAAYMYFTEASFTWLVKNLNFNAIVKWLESLQPSHRALLSRNRNLTIEVIPGLLKLFTYPPKDFLLDDTLQNHWKACQPFGNLYAVRAMHTNSGTRRSLARFDDPGYDPAHDNAKVFFLLFCRLAVWSRLCTQSIYAGIQWKYTFDLPSDSHGKRSLNNALGEHEADLRSFLPQLKKLWTRNRCESRIKQPILELLDAFIGAYAKMESQNPIWYQHSDMVVRLKAQRERISCWNRPPPV
ncbi:hypothetical protein BU25DRAFT_223947 [Macroventuria anomochaeta]|uniref:Uncharacterized protein n=1 Tax=Macroventuria anomochaeta TaxID=301207 RepID=A0ACB6SAJ8_9PLEO|nr:uncharacterized protein BU25DRAFT_223947 [Macroventuria anomochaeta]KAF2631084.1 hypothetical protein BU25DRAFT_223947 [Macroventuria anomochaeta]